MNARYAITLILVGLVLTNCSGCVDTSQESAPDTSQTPAGVVDDDKLTEEEMESIENDLGELEALLGDIEAIDNTEIVNDSVPS